jgi:hypothetical protein
VRRTVIVRLSAVAIGFSASHPKWSYRKNPEGSNPNANMLCDTTPGLIRAHIAGGSMGGAREKSVILEADNGKGVASDG